MRDYTTRSGIIRWKEEQSQFRPIVKVDVRVCQARYNTDLYTPYY